jgi:hypothetical protein
MRSEKKMNHFIPQTKHTISEVSGYTVNLSKYAVYPICCDLFQLENIMQPFPCAIKSLP